MTENERAAPREGDPRQNFRPEVSRSASSNANQAQLVIKTHIAAGTDFEQAENREGGPQFLPIVAKPDRPKPSKSRHKLTRVAFRVSRLMEFCSERELVNQTGHYVDDWPLVVLKELMDNALDACELRLIRV